MTDTATRAHLPECETAHRRMIVALQRWEGLREARADSREILSAALTRTLTLKAYHKACRYCPECSR